MSSSRAHYTARQWKSSHIPSSMLAIRDEYGWKWNSPYSLYEAVTITLPPAPNSTIHLTLYNCKRNDCKNNENGDFFKTYELIIMVY